MRKIYVSDFTLRKLTEGRATPLLFREKTAIAACIDTFGADAIELAAIKNLKEDTIIYKTISAAVQNSAICIPVGFSAEGVAQAWECVKDAKKPCLQIILPMSTVQMEYIYHVKADRMLMKIEELCKAAKEKCANVEFVAADATRADADFLISACKTAQANGATAVTICDDLGTLLPEELAEIVKTVKAACEVPVYVQVSDNISMATATAMSAVFAGADGVKTAVTGDDVLLTAKFADAIRARGEELGLTTELRTTEIHRDINDMMKKIGGSAYNTAEMGNSGSGGAIFLDADSTVAQVSEAAQTLGYMLSDEDNGKVYEALRQVCEKRGSIGAKEFEAIIASSAMQAPSTYHLESYICNSSNITTAMAHITLVKNDEKISGVSTGDGPIDAAFRAIEQSIGYHYELDDFQIQAVTEGKEALGSALVKLRNNGKLYSGNGISTDIVGASIRAYINALNKIVFEEN